MASKKTCLIKIICNSGQPNKYKIEKNLNSKPDMIIQINTQDTEQSLTSLINTIKQDVKFLSSYQLRFNNKTGYNLSAEHKCKLRKLFMFTPKQQQTTVNIDDAAILVFSYKKCFGNAPNFKFYYLPRYSVKIKHYIENILNTSVDAVTVTQICKKINKLANQQHEPDW